ncbi:tryptophan synthase subunit alpha [Georgenia sp. TF02-10]|uniref:tryptophan synthase subunit alpha n=1 Tax=Georgenia sp. TF02-10 TaxID=2917725 RepID=UPI001FA7E9FE|nr:tryptophan synthase subunit alpha [Georgenia sp. TF02-10]UNX56157.1 tryptophan synthase subunit alpha [Georgenia sp. TF02-10]
MTTPTTTPAPPTSRTAAALDAARARGGAALVGYLPVGFPDVPTSVRAAREIVAAGADVVELGLPYSDPGMDGETIQRAAQAALDGGTRTADVLRAVEQVAQTGAAVLVMTYYNPVHRYGVDRFARDLAAAGGAGLITPDLIPDEAGEWLAASDTHGLDRVFLVAPSSTDARLRSTAKACRGFVYAASTMGVTGARAAVDSHARRLVERTRAAGAERVCVGLGVSTGEQAAEIAGYADGVIVGSALVRTLQRDDGDSTAALRDLAALAAELAAGAHGA